MLVPIGDGLTRSRIGIVYYAISTVVVVGESVYERIPESKKKIIKIWVVSPTTKTRIGVRAERDTRSYIICVRYVYSIILLCV